MQQHERQIMCGRLIMCPTPLGNLDDMMPRAIEALRQADTVCAEDTRVTGRLLAAFDISAHLERLDEAMISERAPRIIERIKAGETIAFCSDAGMPGVSDPGQRLITAARDSDVPVDVLPGPTAVATAYVASGFVCPRFYFGGFFPRKDHERKTVLVNLEQLDAVLLFYESPRRLLASLAAIAEQMPHRRIAVCRELTKMHEEVVVDSAETVLDIFRRRDQEGTIRGEIVMVIDAPGKDEQCEQMDQQRNAARDTVAQLLAEGTMSKKDIVAYIRKEYGLSRNDAYEMVHHA
ncbi:MAG: 16S rRNA (cytidine(1402)-2'-O)-methyltransferase [Eggerthellaceae bacterium]|jgi:16S rRNA (cytidine1402-2'-O)-methyltransferase|nr:16S rRNA (cytidine(1402)-2'-O)-methyltransferase [Eggerthellaceae bacterium]